MAGIDKSKCVSCGACFNAYPTVFKQGSDGKAELVHDELTPEEQNIYEEAKPICPMGAIE